MNDYTTLPTTAEEEEAMNAITQDSAEVLHKPQPDLEQILKTISEQFALLSTVINQSKAQPNPTPPEMQACVDAVLEQAGWFKEKVEEKVERLIDDMDHTYAIESAVETHFSNSFSLDDHCDIHDIVEDKVDDKLEDLVNEKIREMLSTATITFNN